MGRRGWLYFPAQVGGGAAVLYSVPTGTSRQFWLKTDTFDVLVATLDGPGDAENPNPDLRGSATLATYLRRAEDTGEIFEARRSGSSISGSLPVGTPSLSFVEDTDGSRLYSLCAGTGSGQSCINNWSVWYPENNYLLPEIYPPFKWDIYPAGGGSYVTDDPNGVGSYEAYVDWGDPQYFVLLKYNLNLEETTYSGVRYFSVGLDGTVSEIANPIPRPASTSEWRKTAVAYAKTSTISAPSPCTGSGGLADPFRLLFNGVRYTLDPAAGTLTQRTAVVDGSSCVLGAISTSDLSYPTVTGRLEGATFRPG